MLIPYPLGEDPNDFPPVEQALTEPNGLLAMGGDLSPERLLAAYRHGIFPWYNQPPILWWSPDPRTVIYLSEIHVSHRLQRLIRQQRYQIKLDQQFDAVIDGCAQRREANPADPAHSTWITPAMRKAYLALFNNGYAHSIEVYREEKLVGGLYGVALGRAFFAESMFSYEANTSKIAMVYLCRHLSHLGFTWIDCQLSSAHLQRMGAKTVSRAEFVRDCQRLCPEPTPMGPWQVNPQYLC